MIVPLKAVIRKVDHYFAFRHYSPLEPALVKPFYVFERVDHPFRHLDSGALSEDIREWFAQCNREHQESEYLIHYTKPCIIEPQFGWALVGKSKFIQESLSYMKPGDALYPSYLRRRFFKKKLIKEKVVISLQHRWDNYWHFLDDILGKLMLLDKWGVPTDIPVVIPKRAYNYRYFTQALERSVYLRSRRWVALGDFDYLQAEECFFAKSMPNVRDHFDGTLDLLQVPVPAGDISRKIFIKRNTDRPRRLSNSEEIEALAIELGFEVIDADLLDLDEQIKLFSQAGVVCAIHGAGLANLIFRRGVRCAVFEIFPRNYVMPNYYWLSSEFGYFYNGICGDAEGTDRAFYLDPDLFRKNLQKFLVRAANA